MLGMKRFQAAALAVAAVGFGFAGTAAEAGSCSSQRSYDRGYHGHQRGHVSATYRNDGFRVSVRVGNDRHYDHRRVTTHRSSRYDRCEPVRTVRHHQPSGYWTTVYRPPVYETRYDRCGYPYRVCVRRGYHEKVWVSTGHHRY